MGVGGEAGEVHLQAEGPRQEEGQTEQKDRAPDLWSLKLINKFIDERHHPN